MSLINENSFNELPYEKCKAYGPKSLSDSELLAVFLRSGTKELSVLSLARMLLGENKDGRGILKLSKKTIPELLKYPGIGEVKAIQLNCMLELSNRIWRMNLNTDNVFDSPEMIANFYMEEMRHLDYEKTKLLLLNTKSVLIKEFDLSIGTVNASVLSPRDVFINALKYEAVFIILLHNHPSGDPTPSAQDLNITNNIKKSGDYLGIKLLDHIIIGDNRYISLSEEGYI